jgi:hypothetical protein
MENQRSLPRRFSMEGCNGGMLCPLPPQCSRSRQVVQPLRVTGQKRPDDVFYSLANFFVFCSVTEFKKTNYKLVAGQLF